VKLRAIGATVGSDVPFCVSGGAALVEGVGDRVTPVPPLSGCALTLCKPPFPVSTAEIFARMDAAPARRRPDTQAALRRWPWGMPGRWPGRCTNVMEETTGALHPEIGEIERRCAAAAGAGRGDVRVRADGVRHFRGYDHPRQRAEVYAPLGGGRVHGLALSAQRGRRHHGFVGRAAEGFP
jgi:4-diphosphocytidyl-2C-methyl-D-erythritol kinase